MRLWGICALAEPTTSESNLMKNSPIRSSQIASYRDASEVRAMRFAMRISVAFGVIMLVGKTAAYFMTGSAAILSDAAESIHVVAVAFAAFSLRLSTKPAAPKFLYGYERITFFSAGFEGAMIVLAAIFILYAAIEKWLTGLQLDNLGPGILLVLAAGVLNAGLGWYLIRAGRRNHSLILEANGKHVLTDGWTSFGVYDPHYGAMLSTRFYQSKPPTILDVPVGMRSSQFGRRRKASARYCRPIPECTGVE